MKLIFSTLLCSAMVAGAAEPAAMSAKDLAAKMSALQQDGSSYVRLKMDTNSGGAKSGLQVQIKQRWNGDSTQLVYQVLWPKERAGEAVLLERKGDQAGGSMLVPPAQVAKLNASQMDKPLLGTALNHSDVVENFFAWDGQKIAGSETMGRVECQILESRRSAKAGTVATVRSWIDTRRMVPMKVEKYDAGGKAVTRIETTKVASDDMNRNLPASMTVTNLKTGAVTELDGSKLKHGVTYQDTDFTPAGLTQTAPPK